MVKQNGVSLVELMIVVALIGLLVLISSPYTISWFQDTDTREMSNLIGSAYKRAKSAALRNPEGVINTGSPAAGIRFAGNKVLVCKGNPSGANCSDGGSSTLWQGDLDASVTVTIGAATASGAYGINSNGYSIDASGNPTSLSYTVKKGSVSHDGNLH